MNLPVRPMKVPNALITFLVMLSINSSISFSENKNETNIINAFPNLSFSNPVDIQHPGDNTNRIFVVSQEGIIHTFENNPDINSSTVFLDISDKVLFGGEQGLLGLAFHPNYISNGYFYLNYTVSNPRRSIISRFSTNENNLADPESEVILLEVDQPYSNHNGGQTSFGPDGYLYISLGDGGSGGDPENRAQNLSSLLGKILRIDVNIEEQGKKYGIPNDNPFKGNNSNVAEEIFAYGLRNVWRFSFDDVGRLWAADVGQNAWEEISLIESGGNYGWRIMEGFHCYNPSINCNREGLDLPIWEYGHNSSGGYSITGGYVYKGESVSQLFNKYIYGDFVTGNIWAFDPIDSSNILIRNFNARISTFGIDQNKELYFSDYNSGAIFKFIDDNTNSIGVSSPNTFKLSQNYPNPFNPSTVIKYSIPNNTILANRVTQTVENTSVNSLPNNDIASVSLIVYDILGREIKVLVNENQSPGVYEVEFNSKSFDHKLSSGVYFYRLIVNDLIDTRKMILQN